MRRILKPDAQPLRGGAVTVREKALLPFGTFSMAQNVRPTRPGFKKRPGQIKQHVTADSTNQVITLYQFRKGKVDEKALFAQMGDNDILLADTAPPGIDSGAFGDTSPFDGTASPDPACWSNVADVMIFSDGVDQHQIYGGESSYVTKFIVFKGAADPKSVPELGIDYSDEVTDGKTTTVAVLDSLGNWAAWDCVYICTPVPADAIALTVLYGNSNAATLSLYYWANDNDWSDASATGTITETPCLAATGTIAWSSPSAAGGAGDEVPTMMFGVHGYWYQIRVSAALDGQVEINSATFQSPWCDLTNVWDNVPVDAIECMVETGVDSGKWENYGSTAVDIDELASGADIMCAFTDPVEGIYIDVGSVPHTGTAITFTINYFTGSGFSTVGTVVDSTDGLYHSGWLRFPQAAAKPHMFQGTNYYAYWYQITTGAAAATADMNIGIQGMPYYNVDDFGVAGQANCCWREHACYTFTSYPEYVYLAMANQPLILNGSEFGILEAGDGRSNKVLSMQPFFNNMLVWQEEKGIEGGCTTIFQGYDPTTYGKLILSTRVGIVNSKASAVVGGVQTSAQSQEKFSSAEDAAKGTFAFWISRYGVCCTDGRTIWVISDDIQNYFDLTQTECIRRGCEDQHWAEFDSTFNVLRLGLVSGEPVMTSTATSTSSLKLVDTAGAFTTRKSVTGHPITYTIAVGDTVYNTTDSTTALITAIDSATQLTLDTDIMASGEAYQILSKFPNLYPVFDLTDKVWYFDVLQQSLSCLKEIEAGSGQLPITQIGGGVADGQVYITNSGTNDVSTLISSYIDVTINSEGKWLVLDELVLRCKVQSAGNITVTTYQNDVQKDSFTLAMTAEVTNDVTRRHRESLNVQGSLITVRLAHATASQSMELQDLGFGVQEWEGR